jgi:type IV pilus assembly protein PilM
VKKAFAGVFQNGFQLYRSCSDIPRQGILSGHPDPRCHKDKYSCWMGDNFLNLIKELGLKPIALDIHPNTVAKLISQNTAINGRPLDKEKTLAFIDLGYYSINIHIISDGKLAFSRIINLGARDLDNEISITCNLSLEQAEKKKIQDAELDPNTFNDLIPDTFHDLVRAQVDERIS